MKLKSQLIIQNISVFNSPKMRVKSTIKNRVAVSLAGLYSTAWTLSFAAVFWGFNSKIFSETALAQSVVPRDERLVPPPPPPPAISTGKLTQLFGIGPTAWARETRFLLKFSASQS
jgi:hypothetical protein